MRSCPWPEGQRCRNQHVFERVRVHAQVACMVCGRVAADVPGCALRTWHDAARHRLIFSQAWWGRMTEPLLTVPTQSETKLRHEQHAHVPFHSSPVVPPSCSSRDMHGSRPPGPPGTPDGYRARSCTVSVTHVFHVAEDWQLTMDMPTVTYVLRRDRPRAILLSTGVLAESCMRTGGGPGRTLVGREIGRSGCKREMAWGSSETKQAKRKTTPRPTRAQHHGDLCTSRTHARTSPRPSPPWTSRRLAIAAWPRWPGATGSLELPKWHAS
jgi:hypothetical protein